MNETLRENDQRKNIQQIEKDGLNSA